MELENIKNPDKLFDLLKLIAKYLLDVETLTKEDIDEIASTGKLSRWDDVLANELDNKTESATVEETASKTDEVKH